MVAIAGDHAVLVGIERRLQPDRDRFLADVEVAEAADQAEAVELAGLLLEPADQQHLLVEVQQLVLARAIARVLLEGLLQAAQLEIFAALPGFAAAFCDD